MEDNKLSEIAATLQRLLKWNRFAVINEVKNVLPFALELEVVFPANILHTSSQDRAVLACR